MRDNNPNTVWRVASQPPTLESDRVHLWRANLNLPPREISRLVNFLSPDEIIRADRFRFDRHRSNFIASRGILRQLLGTYLHLNPQNIKFDYGDRGKPILANSQPDLPLQFNLSHSQEYALFGFTIDRAIGVDLEYLREMQDALKIAQRFFSGRESDLIADLDPKQQQQAFFKLWTAKEAYLKAIGVGLMGSLSNVEIMLNPGENDSILINNPDSDSPGQWSVYPCIPATNYVGAIAIPKPITQQQINFWSWQQDL